MFSSHFIEIFGSLGAISIFVLLTLLLFSVSSWGIIVYKWRMFQATDREEKGFLQAYEQSYLHNAQEFENVKKASLLCSLSPSGAVFVAVTNKVDQQSNRFRSHDLMERSSERHWPDRHYIEKVVQYTVQEQINQQERYLPFLATTGNITPFIGLFGTVIGVMNAFRGIGQQGTANIAAVAPGVAEALVATAAGLFAAIPAVVAYNYFLTKIRKSSSRVEAFSIEFLNALDELASDVNEAEVVQ